MVNSIKKIILLEIILEAHENLRVFGLEFSEPVQGLLLGLAEDQDGLESISQPTNHFATGKMLRLRGVATAAGGGWYH